MNSSQSGKATSHRPYLNNQASASTEHPLPEHLLTEHLSDEQFADLMAGEQTGAVASAHLEACAACRTELSQIRASMAELDQVSLAWAQIEAPRRIQAPTPWVRWGRALSIQGALAAAVVAGTVGFHLHMDRVAQGRQLAPEASATQAEPSTGELAEDDRLMMSIDRELQYGNEVAVPASELKVTSHAPRRHVPVRAAD